MVELFGGDNLPVMQTLAEGSVQLIYADPPYFTRRVRKGASRDAAGGIYAYGDFCGESRAAYLEFMEPRLRACHRILRPSGVLCVQADSEAIHYLKVLLDGIFGSARLINEIIWHYQSGGRAEQAFARKHDTILAYGRSGKHLFRSSAVAQPVTPKNHLRRGIDETGAAYRAVRANGKEYRYPENRTRIPDDVWSDIPHLQQRHPERTGYPTQKPEALLTRLIEAFSGPGDTVADFFCGSGTTLVAAHRLGRNAIGCDANPAAIEATRARLRGRFGFAVDLRKGQACGADHPGFVAK